MVNQRNSEKTVQRCGNLAFNYDSTVDKPLVAAEHKDKNKNHIGRQSQGVEGFNFSIHGTNCQNPKIVQLEKSEEFSSFPIIQFDPVSQKENEEAVWRKMFNLLKRNKTNSDEELHHFDLKDLMIKKCIHSDGNWSFLIGLGLLFSYLKEICADESQEKIQNFGSI
jgi:hypothetical protein